MKPAVATFLPPVPGSAAVLPAIQVILLSLVVLAVFTYDPSAAAYLPVVISIAFLAGGLPHGAFDIHRIMARGRLGNRGTVVLTAAYIAIAVTALWLWQVAPALVMVLFLTTAWWHFAEDWHAVAKPLFRAALGLAPVISITVGHTGEVEQIFAAMSTPATATILTDALVLAAPVVLLVALVALWSCWKAGQRQRAVPFALLLAVLPVLPPLIGFALFFCLFHTPLHMRTISRELSDWPVRRMLAVGAGLSVLGTVLGLLLLPHALEGGTSSVAAAFQLLAALALPHQSVGLLGRLVEQEAKPQRKLTTLSATGRTRLPS